MMFEHENRRLNRAGITRLWLLAALCVFSLPGIGAQANNAQAAGARTFLMFCAGCHGKDGFAAYENAPSFSMGERLKKDDRELLQSVLNGKNEMPPWRDMLPVEDLRNAITYIRLMHERQLKGEPPLQVEAPNKYYMFKPVGEDNMDWDAKEGK